MQPKFMSRINRIAERIRSEGSLSIMDIIMHESLSISYVEKIRVVILEMFPDIQYDNRRFFVNKKID